MGNLRQKHRLKNKFPIAPFRNKHFNSDLNISTDFDLKKKKDLSRRLSPHKPPQITVEMLISERCNSTIRR